MPFKIVMQQFDLFCCITICVLMSTFDVVGVTMKEKSTSIDNFSSIIGAEIASLRKMRLLSGKQFGNLIGVSQQQISRYETGTCEITTVMLCVMLCHLGISVESFFSLVARRLQRNHPALYFSYHSLFEMKSPITKTSTQYGVHT